MTAEPIKYSFPSMPMRNVLLVCASACVAVWALGAYLFFSLQLHSVGILVALPAWLISLWLLGWQLRARLSLAALAIHLLVAGVILHWYHSVELVVYLLLGALTLGAWGMGRLQRYLAPHQAALRERALQQQWQQALHGLVLDQSNECVKQLRPDGTLLAINLPGVRLLGASSQDELIGRNWLDFWGPAARRRAEEAFVRALAGEVAVFEAPANTLAGVPRHWHNRITAVIGPDGERQLLCISRDVTADIETATQLQQQLRQSRLLTDALSDALVVCDGNWQVNYVNPMARELLQIEPDAPVTQSLWQLLPARPDSDLERATQECSRDRQPHHCQFFLVQRMVWLGASILPAADAGVAILLRDVGATRESESLVPAPGQLQLIQEMASMGDWLFDGRKGLLVLSDAALNVLGMKEATPVGGSADGGHKKAVLALLHPDDRPILVQALIHAANGGEPLDITVRRPDLMAVDGYRRIRWRARRAAAGSDGAMRLLGVLRVEDGGSSGEAVARSNRRLLQSTLEALPTAMLVCDVDGRVVAVNSRWVATQAERVRDPKLKSTGAGDNYLQRFAQVVARTTDAALHERMRADFEATSAVIRRESAHHVFEYDINGLVLRTHVLPLEGGSLTIVACEDITTQRELSSAVATHNRRLAQAMDATCDGVWIWNRDSGATYYSNQFAALLRYPREQLPELDELLRTTAHPDDRGRVDAQLAAFEYPVDGQNFDCELRLLVASTEFRWFRLRGAVQRRASGEVEIAGSAMDIQHERDLRQQLYDAAFRDDVTGLPNRRELVRRLEQACGCEGASGALLLLDIDRFKNVNTTLGVSVGDDLLRQVAERLTSVAGERAEVAHLGGDEFAVMLPGIPEDALGEHGVALLDRLRAPFRLDGQELFITASVGVARCPQDGHDPDALLRAADAALRRAKQSGRDNVQFFEPRRQLPGRERMALETELRQALARGEFELFYQGKYTLDSGVLVGAEALLRWRSQHRGLVAPGEFIPLLEETGLILPVGEWVLAEACRQVCAWYAQTGTWFPVSVNVSAIQMAAPDFGDRAVTILRETVPADAPIPPQILQLEITESALMADVEQGAQILKVLKQAGFAIALDDFGTGYSSLGYLRRFSPHTLKMDRSFIADLEQDASAREIAAAVVHMAQALAIEVVAEGVETPAQRDILNRMRCPVGQGYLFGRPLPAAELEQQFHTAAARVVNLAR